MSDWETISEEASIVLVGNMNPKIFHPEWFIRKEIVEEWDYINDEVINLPDMSQIELPNSRKVLALLNQFSVRSSQASEHLSLKDFINHTFSFLTEMPIRQIGMNYISVIKITNINKWKQFSQQLAPQQYWRDAVDYIDSLDEDKQSHMGLWELTMNLPRPNDTLNGHIRPKIAVLPQAGEQVLAFSINNHVEIEGSDVSTMSKILDENWDKSLSLAQQITSNIMTTHLKVPQ